jgi:hypothetical protein
MTAEQCAVVRFLREHSNAHRWAEGIVYFIGRSRKRGTDYVKIGWTLRNVDARLNALQGGSPERLVLLGVYPGPQAREEQRHSRYRHLRVGGEWFRPDEHLWFDVEHSYPEPGSAASPWPTEGPIDECDWCGLWREYAGPGEVT